MRKKVIVMLSGFRVIKRTQSTREEYELSICTQIIFSWYWTRLDLKIKTRHSIGPFACLMTFWSNNRLWICIKNVGDKASIILPCFFFFFYSPVIRELLNKEKGWKRDTNDYDTLDVRMNRSKVCEDIYLYIYRYMFININSLCWSVTMTEMQDIPTSWLILEFGELGMSKQYKIIVYLLNLQIL